MRSSIRTKPNGGQVAGPGIGSSLSKITPWTWSLAPLKLSPGMSRPPMPWQPCSKHFPTMRNNTGSLNDSDNPLAVEIRQEMAATYFAACKKMIDSLEALKAFDQALASSTPDRSQTTRRTELL